MLVSPRRKLRVFISSKCDKAGEQPKYNPIRHKLKEIIEKTELADVYVFEDESASVLSAESHYTYNLQDSDVCIFLIDNADGIPEGVKKEIEVVKKHKIKSLFYFCDERSKQQTELEKSLMGATFAKSKPVHKFSDLCKEGAIGLLDDIVTIYHNFCKDRIVEINEEYRNVDVSIVPESREFAFPKLMLKSIDKCTGYIFTFMMGRPLTKKIINSSIIDEWGLQFLKILFEHKSIKDFNTSLYLEYLKEQHDPVMYEIVELRWKAIQSYYNDNLSLCIDYLQKALEKAKTNNQPNWLIDDILIDLRNEHWELCEAKNIYTPSEAQKELDDRDGQLYYPVLDRITDSLQEKYIDGLYAKRIESPYTVEFGSGIDQYCQLLAGSYIVSIYNGSLTQILLLYKRIKDCLFYLSNKYSDWSFKYNLLKFAIFSGIDKEANGINNAYPEVLNHLSPEEAEEIIQFCYNHPIVHKRTHRLLISFGVVGYYLSEAVYDKYEAEILSIINEWLDSEKHIFSTGGYIFKCLSEVYYRMPQDILAKICCKFIDKHFSRWYVDMFKFITHKIDVNKLTPAVANDFIEHIISILNDDAERETVRYSGSFLCSLRKQNYEITNELDKLILKYFSEYYNSIYRIETTQDAKNDYPEFARKFIINIRKNNEQQGKDGRYFGHGTNEIRAICLMMMTDGVKFDNELINLIITTVTDTIIESKEPLYIKMDAVLLLCLISKHYPSGFNNNSNIINKIYEKRNEINDENIFFLSSNIDEIAVKICLQFLFSLMGHNVHSDLLEMLPYIKNDTATIVFVSNFLLYYITYVGINGIPKTTESVILYNVIEWVDMEHIDIRCNAIRILLMLLGNPEHEDIINRKLKSLAETDSVTIKNLILRNIFDNNAVTNEVKTYIFEVCEKDANYVTRTVCKEMRNKIAY